MQFSTFQEEIVINASDVQEHMDVVGSDNKHVGKVDGVEGDRIKLTKSDAMSGGQHHYIMLDAVDSMDRNTLRLRNTAQEAMQQWQAAEMDQGGMAASATSRQKKQMPQPQSGENSEVF